MIEILPTRPGHFRFRPPFSNESFLEEFERRIGRPFRCWNVFQQAWDIKPIDRQMLDLVADLLRRHFNMPVDVKEAR